MNNYELASLEFCIKIYGGSYREQNDVLFIMVGRDKFRINLTDKFRFGTYTIYHQNNRGQLDYYHNQGNYRSLDSVLFNCFTHDLNKRLGLRNSSESFFRFKEKLAKYRELSKMEI